MNIRKFSLRLFLPLIFLVFVYCLSTNAEAAELSEKGILSNFPNGTNWADKAEIVKIYHNSLYSVQRNLWEKIEDGNKDNWDNWDIINNIFYSINDNVTFRGDDDCRWEGNLYFGTVCPAYEITHQCCTPMLYDLNTTLKNMRVLDQCIAIFIFKIDLS